MNNHIILKKTADDLFEGQSTLIHFPRYYGGEIMAQAVLSCGKTVEHDFILHSMSCNFLFEGSTDRPLAHHINRIKDGSQFSVRQVNITQEENLIFTAVLSFQVPEKGPEHQTPMPDLPGPDGVASEGDRFYNEASGDLRKNNPYDIWPFEFREIDPVNLFKPEKKPPSSALWFKSKNSIEDDPLIQQAMLTSASDAPILAAAMRPHGLGYWAGNVQPATIYHAVWFHRPCRVDDWLLYVIESHAAYGSRGIAYGNIFNRDGRLVATVMQEGLIRPV